MTVKSKTTLLSSISSDLADNNAGLISAAHVRNNLYDVVDSINSVVSSGDHNNAYPFYNNVRASNATGNGIFIAESGIQFPNVSATVQTEAYPGAAGINHDSLANRNASVNAHTQYLAVNGTRPMEENLPMANHWINASGAGTDNKGLQFVGDNINVGLSGQFVYADGSKINSGRATAKAWINFDGSGGAGLPVVNAAYQVEALQRISAGKYKVTMPSGVLNSTSFVAIGHSNARTSNANGEDFDRNTVGVVKREHIAANGITSVTFYVLNEQGDYVDAEVNDLVIFGFNQGETGTTPTVTVS